MQINILFRFTQISEVPFSLLLPHYSYNLNHWIFIILILGRNSVHQIDVIPRPARVEITVSASPNVSEVFLQQLARHITTLYRMFTLLTHTVLRIIHLVTI